MNNELVPQPSWWKRNWKWVVPLGGCLTVIVFAIVLFTSIYFGVTKIMEDSKPYVHAFELINNDEQLIELLGSPIAKDGAVQGNIDWINGNKSAQMSIPISGPKGSGTLYINATGKDETWNYHEIRVEINEQEINLLEKP